MKVKAFSKYGIQFLLDEVGCREELNSGRLCIVSIKDSIGEYAIPPHPNVLQLEFDDEDPKNPDNLQPYYDLGRVLFDGTQAKQLEQFFHAIKAHGRCNFLAINCMAGISRSGAIAAYAASFFDVPDHVFREHNSHIDPNQWVLRFLGMDHDAVMRTVLMSQRDEHEQKYEEAKPGFWGRLAPDLFKRTMGSC